MCVLRSVLVSVGFGRVLHGCCGIVSPPPAHQVSLFGEKTRIFPLPFSPLLSLLSSRMYDSLVLLKWRVDVCVISKI